MPLTAEVIEEELRPLLPTGEVTYTPLAPVSSQEITFSSNATTKHDGETIEAANWDFGDGTGLPDANLSQAHTYQEAGTYDVMVTFEDSEGNRGQCWKRVIVTQGPTCQITLGTGFTDGTATVDVECSFDSNAAAVSPATISSVDWDWGDESEHGSGETAAHTYTVAGTYTVDILATDSNAVTVSDSLEITVGPGE